MSKREERLKIQCWAAARTQRACAHILYKHTHKWSDSSHSECQLLSVISLVPQEMCEHTTTALPHTHTHTHTAKPILLTMRADGKRQEMESSTKKEGKQQQHSAEQSRINMRISSLRSSPVNPLRSHPH